MRYKTTSEYLKDIIQLYIVFFILVISIYKAPQVIALVIQVIFLFAFYRSKKGYFWLALVFIAVSEPGSLFIITDRVHSFSLLQNTPLGLLYFWMVFEMVALVKTFRQPVKYPFFLNSIVIAMLLYVVVEIVAFKLNKLSDIGSMIPWLIIYTTPRILKKMVDYEKFFVLICSFVFFEIATQILFLIVGNELNVLLGGIPNSSLSAMTLEEASVALRPTSGLGISLLGMIGASFFLIYKKTSISRNFLLVSFFSAFLSIILSGTRGWMIAGAIILITFLSQSSKRFLSLLPRLIVPLIAIILLFSFVPSLKKQIDLVAMRFESIELLMEGDKTAGGTLNRLDERGPVVMKKFWESPILGFGYGPEAAKFGDGHVGNQNLLMRFGILGYGLFAFLWLSFITKMAFRNKDMLPGNPYKGALMTLVGSLLALLFIHSTSSQWFNYGMGYDRAFIWMVIFLMGSYGYYDSFRVKET